MNNKVTTIIMPDGRKLDLAGSGSGVPSGGTTGQVLAKNSATDGDVSWVDVVTKVTPDKSTLIQNADGSLTVIGVQAKDGSISYEWHGSLRQYQDNLAAGIIQPNWICYISDYGEPVTSTADPKVTASTEYVSSQVNPLKADYEEFKQKVEEELTALKKVDTDYSVRLDAIEQALGVVLDKINGEVI